MNTDGKTRVYGIIANPVEHSMSPLLQNLYAAKTGINAAYVPLKVEEENLKAAVKGAFSLNIQGMNVTVPHKQAVMQYLSDIDETAAAIGAVNTLVRTETGYKGYNTDVPGLSRAIREAGITIKGKSCILIGAGGASKAAAYLMAKEGAELIYVLNRSVDKAEELSFYMNNLFGRILMIPMALKDYGQIPKGRYLAVQTTSVGMHPQIDEVPIKDETFYENISEAVEVIYTPLETQFMKRVRAAGGRAINGLDMLLYQGVIAYELWNQGITIDTETIDEARQLIMQKLQEARDHSVIETEELSAIEARDHSATEAGTHSAEEAAPSGNRGHLVLIGFMGAGKTSVGERYAKKHKLPVVDTDRLIEITSGMSVSDIFVKKGEAEFRRRETETLKRFFDIETVAPQKTLISVGGGLPLNAENRALLKQLGTVVYLRVSPDTVLDRLKGDKTRPLLQGENVRQKVEALLASREPYYMEAAHVVVEADGKDFDRIMEEIEKAEPSKK